MLQSIKPDLVRAIDFGMFDWLVVPLLRALKWVNSYVGNYGWSIIVLTIIINLVMFPLKHKSIVSMRKMQELQPQMKAIQDRYAKLKMTDPGRQKMNEEVMALYKQHGTNPASGCVPMLLTLPVLVAFYAMLSVAIELRGAPFVGWIKDLSSFDPYFVTPILMGATMFVQQKMTPSVADPVQAKMMMFMPLMFTGMLMWAPSGLVIYWTSSNLWAIGQQVLDQPADRSAAAAQRAPAGRAATEERRGGKVAAGEGAEVMELTTAQGRVREFLEQTLGAMGLPLEIAIEDSPDSVRLDLSGEGGDVLLQRRGETLDALQHIVNTAFRRELDGDRSFVLDCLGYRRGQGRRAPADGALQHGEGQDLRRTAGDRAAESVRPPPRAHHRRDRSATDVGEHR